jgi:hypothetical protein
MNGGARWTVLRAGALIPPAWRRSQGAGPAWCFNPSLLRCPQGWLLVYRVVLADQQRRLALCRLDEHLSVIDGTQIPLSDRIRFDPREGYSERVTTWFADPRLHAFAGRLFVYFNSGWHAPRNHQFVVELQADTGWPADLALEIDLVESRQPLEKNWVFLAGGLDTLVYSPSPHRIARQVDQAGRRLRYQLADAAPPAPGPDRLGPGLLRGGATPVPHQGLYYSFCHVIQSQPERIDYRVGLYRFGTQAPHAPRPEGAVLLDLALPESGRRQQPPLNPAVSEVIYPGGAAFHDHAWFVACGLNDEHCAIVRLDAEAVEACLAPARAGPTQVADTSSR